MIKITGKLRKLGDDEIIEMGDLHSLHGHEFHTIKGKKTVGITVAKYHQNYGNVRQFYRFENKYLTAA